MKLKFALLLIFLLPTATFSEDGGSPIGYPSVGEALEALRANPEAKISTQGGWTVVEVKNDEEMTLWSFTPESSPAHPAAIKRTIVEKDGSIYIDMKVLCQAEKKECDLLIQQFEQLNDNIRKSVQAGS